MNEIVRVLVTPSPAYVRIITGARGPPGPTGDESKDDPIYYGAVGDGEEDDSEALYDAFESGYPIRGRGRSYAVDGQLTVPPEFKGFSDFEIAQTDPSVVGRRTLTIDGVDDWVMDNGRFDLGGEYVIGNFGGVGNIGLDIRNCGHFSLRRQSLRRGGKMQGLHIQSCGDFSVYDPIVKDFRWETTVAPDDDLIDGFGIQLSERFCIVNPKLSNLTGFVNGVELTTRTRGLVLGGCSRASIIGGNLDHIGQAVDFTGSGSNDHISIDGMKIEDAGTVGIKLANFWREITISNVEAIRCGLAGFFFSRSQSNPTPDDTDPRVALLVNCIARDTGSNGVWAGNNIAGFLVDREGTIFNFPRQIKAVNCKAIDKQAVKTMRFGFYSDLSDIPNPDEKNIAVECDVEGATTSNYTSWVVKRGRRVLQTDVDIYISPLGSDDNSGVNQGTAFVFRSTQKAWDTLAGWDLNGFTVTVNGVVGAYEGLIATKVPQGSGAVIIKGDMTDPDGMVVEQAAGHCFSFPTKMQATVSIFFMTMKTTTSGSCIFVNSENKVIFSVVTFDDAADFHVVANVPGALIITAGDYAITGDANSHAYALGKGQIELQGRTVTISGSQNFPTGFVRAETQGQIRADVATFPGGTVTGKRYGVATGGLIVTGGGGANYFPGNSAGTEASGGIYQ